MPNIQLLQASVDPDDTSEFRILVDNKHVKYLTIDPGLYTAEDMCFAPSLIAMLPPLPPGDWNEGHISRSPADGHPSFARVAATQLPAITHIWHQRHIDHLELSLGRKLRSNVYEAVSPHHFNASSTPVIVKFARFGWEIAQLDAETRAYSWIDGRDIGPAFLAHLGEEGRVIGFVLERIGDGAQHAGPEHLSPCRQTLARLHQLDIMHGDVNRHNFLVREGRATLVDFDNAQRCHDAEMLKKELESLEEELRETSGRGGVVTESS